MLDALVILLVVVTLGAALRGALVRTVKARQAVIVRNKITGNARRIEVGPCVADVLPFVEDAQLIDLHLRTTSLAVATAVTHDGLPMAADADAVWAIDPALLNEADLNEIMPLLDGLESLIRQRMNYVLRTTIGQYTMSAIQQIARKHNGLEQLVAARLQELVAPFGVRIYRIRLICQPEATMLNARIAGEARAQELVALAGVFGQDVQMDALMRLELLEACRRSNRQPLTAFDLPSPFAFETGDGPSRVQVVLGPH